MTFQGFVIDTYNDLQWLLTPTEVFKRIMSETNVRLQITALDGIESRHQIRSEWITEFKKRKEQEA